MIYRPKLDGIVGLRWQRHRRISNGEDSYVVPFPRTRPTTIVFHGSENFEYGHYGIHLGQEDRLTFLGDPNQYITAYFIDCRKKSSTKNVALKVDFPASSEWELRIPPGVAHAFENLQNVSTLNNYRLFLPDPEDWLGGETDWDITSDVINLPMDVDPQNVELFQENQNPAADAFYDLLNQRQKETLPTQTHAYPYTTDYHLPHGERVVLKVKEKIEPQTSSDWEAIGDLEGLGWQRLSSLQSGKLSGFVPLNECRPYYVIDHGTNEYTHDAFGIHTGQIDHLIFLGSSAKKVDAEFVDCRHGSATLHKRVQHSFYPSALRKMIIPMGIAHRFINIEDVFTLNQGEIFLDDNLNYEPGNDVLDWPIDRQDFPVLHPNIKPADQPYYTRLKNAQLEALIAGNIGESTPVVVMAKDNDGQDVRVAIRSAEK